MPSKYNKDEVLKKVEALLAAGVPRHYTRLAEELGIPETSFRRLVGNDLPEVEEEEIEVPEPAMFKEIAVLLMSEGPLSLTQLANALDHGPATIQRRVDAMMGSGMYDIQVREQRILLPQKPELARGVELEDIWPDGDELMTAHLSDLHFGSIYHQGSALRHFTQRAVDLGCQHGMVSGDITVGTYKDRDRTEIYAYGADEQIEATCEGLPEVPGFTWYLEGGNHDKTHYTLDGVNVVRRICELRDDCVYIGFTKQDIPLTRGLKMRLWHPRGGKTYARSYRGQKGAEAASYDWLTEAVGSDEEAKAIVILQWGHVHYSDAFWYGPMLVFNPGCFEAEYEWEAAGAMTPEIAGVILKTRMSQEGWGSEYEFKWLRYRAVDDDYTPVKHVSLLDCEEIEPLFSLAASDAQ